MLHGLISSCTQLKLVSSLQKSSVQSSTSSQESGHLGATFTITGCEGCCVGTQELINRSIIIPISNITGLITTQIKRVGEFLFKVFGKAVLNGKAMGT